MVTVLLAKSLLYVGLMIGFFGSGRVVRNQPVGWRMLLLGALIASPGVTTFYLEGAQLYAWALLLIGLRLSVPIARAADRHQC